MVASEVTSDTPLEQFNLDWSERNLPEKQRTRHVHRLHPYLGKYIPQLVEVFLRKYFAPGQTILDPFCGSGTTLIQANELGIRSIGYDISAFNAIICHAKTDRYDLKKVRLEILDILEKTRQMMQQSWSDLPLFRNMSSSTLLTTDNEYLNKWYAPQALHELLIYRNLINTHQYEYTALLQVILSRAARSARLTTHFDLDFPKKPQHEPYFCYKHNRICSPITQAWKFLERYSHDSLKRVEEFASVRTDAPIEIYHGDSRNGNFPLIDGIITSPPYVGLIDYHEQHAYAYHLLNLEQRSDSEIGAAAKGKSNKARSQYVEDIASVFRHTAASLPVGGRMIVVAGDRDNLYETIAEKAGVEVEHILQRHVGRRTGRRSTEFYESIFIWRKV